ncbi:hypothetical protein V500_10968 [Pseudogymnoascus sp. VKM F-4518 (FW-2643)]|nr:hypothetical protein V500_10968 [Pseudogymnoascus sp. VKM F-4518 (FW-2643)]
MRRRHGGWRTHSNSRTGRVEYRTAYPAAYLLFLANRAPMRPRVQVPIHILLRIRSDITRPSHPSYSVQQYRIMAASCTALKPSSRPPGQPWPLAFALAKQRRRANKHKRCEIRRRLSNEVRPWQGNRAWETSTRHTSPTTDPFSSSRLRGRRASSRGHRRPTTDDDFGNLGFGHRPPDSGPRLIAYQQPTLTAAMMGRTGADEETERLGDTWLGGGPIEEARAP